MQTRPAAPHADQRTSSLGYLPGLDGLRAISVLAVLAFHHYFIGGHEPGFAPGGFLGVEVFFVVSGYLITVAAPRASGARPGASRCKRFWLRRARRLLPALFVLLAVVVAVRAACSCPTRSARLKSDTLAALTYTSNWWQVISHQSYVVGGRTPGAAQAPVVARDRGAVLPALAARCCCSVCASSDASRMLGAMFGVALASTILMAIVATGSINAAYYST